MREASFAVAGRLVLIFSSSGCARFGVPTRAHLLVLVLLVAVGRASTALLPSPLIVVVVRLERARADAATTRARATLRGVAIVEFALRAKPRLELRLWVVVLRGLRDPIHLVPVRFGMGR